jgi:hypothetical protein
MISSYDEAPDTWYFFAFAASFIVAMASIYVLKSTLPWWGLIFSMILLWVYMLFFGAQYAITGFQFNLGNVSQTLAGYLFPGKPLGTFNFLHYPASILQTVLTNTFQRTCISPHTPSTQSSRGNISFATLNLPSKRNSPLNVRSQHK